MRGVRWIWWSFLLGAGGTLAHRNDVGRWEANHSAMAAPDEFSYLLMAENLLHGGGMSTQRAVGRDTFYPPGYPLLLAAWAGVVGLTVFHAHVLNAVLLFLATLLVYVLARRLMRALGETERCGLHFRMRFRVGGGADRGAFFRRIGMCWRVRLYVFSEPAFMVVTLGWVGFSLRWRRWGEHVGQTVVLRCWLLWRGRFAGRGLFVWGR